MELAVRDLVAIIDVAGVAGVAGVAADWLSAVCGRRSICGWKGFTCSLGIGVRLGEGAATTAFEGLGERAGDRLLSSGRARILMGVGCLGSYKVRSDATGLLPRPLPACLLGFNIPSKCG